MRWILTALLAIVTTGAASAAALESATPAAIAVPRVASAPPTIADISDPAWQKAAHVTMDWDLLAHGRAREATTAYVCSDGTFLYVAFDARQSESVVATQHTNNAGYGADDDVQIVLWPGGANGFQYQFVANPIGTHYQFSSENTAYEPKWTSVAKIVPGGYVVVMRIPMDVMRGTSGAGVWKVQFARAVESTGNTFVYAYDTNATSPTDVRYAGSLTGLRTVAVRPQSRVAVYGLGTIAGSSIGGSTSRAGLDLSIPITATSSFYATIHPDYSNVERDQQSISPTAFRRSFSEIRPFFTQGQSSYNNFDCDACSGYTTTLYTPGIPTPRDGYAIEGKQGEYGFGAFDAVGVGRSDSAQALRYTNGAHTIFGSVQRIAVNMPGFHDDALEGGLSVGDGKHLSAYFNYAVDSGTNVLHPERAKYYDGGGGWANQTTAIFGSLRKIGSEFNPYDGFVSHGDIAGYAAYYSHAVLFAPGRPLRSVTWSGFVDRYHGTGVGLNQTDQNYTFDLLTRGLIDVSLSAGSSFLRMNNGVFSPVSQNGVSVTFGSGASNASVNNGAQHGQGATPTTVAFYTGRFGPGSLNSSSLASTIRAGKRGLVSGELDDNRQFLDRGGRFEQWLERVAYTYQAGPDESFALGVRRIIGTPPELEIDQVPSFQSGWNLSAAFHRIVGPNELYAVYGDASAFATSPQFIVKWIHYFGAGKGT
ncbi:MAG TPA: hypothetical protein VIG32_04570 [Candidatus Baltobacteraceae bacterium]|jgi:hypothetical protein